MDDHWADYFAATTNAAERAAFANGQEYMRQQYAHQQLESRLMAMNDLDLIELAFTRVRDFYRDAGYQGGELGNVLDRIVVELRAVKPASGKDDPHHGLGRAGMTIADDLTVKP